MPSNETHFERISRVFKELSSIVANISCFVGEKHENPRFIGNKILFFDESYMILILTCRDKRMLSNATSFERIPRVFKELSSNTPKISCSLGERQGNQSFFESKIFFFKERYMFLMLTCRVKRMISNATGLKSVTWIFKELLSIIATISSSVDERHKNQSFIWNKWLFFSERCMFLILTCRVKRILSNANSFERIAQVCKDSSSNISETSCSLRETHESKISSKIKYSSPKNACFWCWIVESN